MNAYLYSERQHLAAWVHLLVFAAIIGSSVTILVSPPEMTRLWIIIPVLLGVAVYALFTPLTVTVDADAMHVRFGRIGWPRWIFPIDEINELRVVIFRPLRDYGGWGMRRGDDGYCLNQRGNSGVRFEHVGGTYTVGSDDPERLLAALETAGAQVGEE